MQSHPQIPVAASAEGQNCSTVSAEELFEECLHQRLEPLPDSIAEICPAEFLLFNYLDQLQNSIDESLHQQQVTVNEAWNHFASLDDHKGIGSKRSTLRLHIYNLHFNQKTQQQEIDTYSTTNLTNIAPPRWVLRVQGRLIETQSAKTSLTPRMTSFFEKIVISRESRNSTSRSNTGGSVTWDRRIQSVQPLLEVPIKLAVLQGLRNQQSKAVLALGRPPFRTLQQSTALKGTLINNINDNNQAPNVVDEMIIDENRSLQLIDTTAAEGVIRNLGDCDGIEYASEGDEEEVVQIVFFPAYKVSHYTLSSELEKLVGINPASLSTITEAIWLKARKSVGDKQALTASFTALPCSPQLQKLFGISESTFNLCDLPKLLIPHLFHLSPLKIEHTIKLTGDVIENEQIVDISVDVSEVMFPVFSNISPWINTSSSFTKQSSEQQQSGTEIPTDPQQASIPTTTSSVTFTESTFESPLGNDNKSFGTLQCHEFSDLWDDLLSSISKRNFLLDFAKDPNLMTERLLTSRHIDVTDYRSTIASTDFLREYEIADQKPEFYQQPWVVLAVESYLANRKKNFVDVVGKVLSAAATERRNLTNLKFEDPVVESLQAEHAPKISLTVDPHADSSYNVYRQNENPDIARVPVFSQISKHHHDHPFSLAHSHGLSQTSGLYVHPGTYSFASPHTDPRFLVPHHQAEYIPGSSAFHSVGVPPGMATARFLPYSGPQPFGMPQQTSLPTSSQMAIPQDFHHPHSPQ